MSDIDRPFDAVQMMTTIRDRISAQIAGMTAAQERAWLDSQEIADPFLRRLLGKAHEKGTADGGRRRA